MLQYNYTVPIHLGSKLSRIVSINRSLSRFVSFLFCLRRGVLCLSIVASTFLLSIEFNSDSLKRITMCPPMRQTQKIHRQEAYCPLSIFYIHDMRSAVIMSQFTPSTAPLNATRPCPRKSAPDPLGCGSVRVKRRNTPCLGDCQENTTLSGGGQPPSPRKSSGLVDDCRLRPVCYAR